MLIGMIYYFMIKSLQLATDYRTLQGALQYIVLLFVLYSWATIRSSLINFYSTYIEVVLIEKYTDWHIVLYTFLQVLISSDILL